MATVADEIALNGATDMAGPIGNDTGRAGYDWGLKLPSIFGQTLL
jgi:hypothetical protein